jgi:hypothetical protein
VVGGELDIWRAELGMLFPLKLGRRVGFAVGGGVLVRDEGRAMRLDLR